MHCLVCTDTDLYSLTKGKSYLAKQKWRRSTCLRDQCYDVGCHPCFKDISYITNKVSVQFSSVWLPVWLPVQVIISQPLITNCP